MAAQVVQSENSFGSFDSKCLDALHDGGEDDTDVLGNDHLHDLRAVESETNRFHCQRSDGNEIDHDISELGSPESSSGVGILTGPGLHPVLAPVAILQEDPHVLVEVINETGDELVDRSLGDHIATYWACHRSSIARLLLRVVPHVRGDRETAHLETLRAVERGAYTTEVILHESHLDGGSGVLGGFQTVVADLELGGGELLSSISDSLRKSCGGLRGLHGLLPVHGAPRR